MTTDNTAIARGLAELVHASGTNSRDHGFHADWPNLRNQPFDGEVEKHQTDLRRAIAEKVALIHEEISEMLGEIRSGHDPLDIYYVEKGTGNVSATQLYDDDGKPMFKPEGFLVEAADAIIRLADLTYLVDGSDKLIEAREIKHEYNATRPYKHGRKF
jgi:hypothetical protein